ncbi:MAG: hypothetical protein GX592_00660 [Clostridiales bacterium]|nr:hypothetical protein [Clostridiales bacterium]
MSRPPTGLTRWSAFFAAALWLITILACVTGLVPGAATAAAGSRNVFSIRSQLLMEAMDYVGVCDPEAAATVWAEGLRQRSAAMQYSVMDDDLRETYAADLDRTFPNWVTGVSSPWIERYEILRINPLGDSRFEIELAFETATSTGPAGTCLAALTVEEDDGFYRIEGIRADEGLNAYTGFLP